MNGFWIFFFWKSSSKWFKWFWNAHLFQPVWDGSYQGRVRTCVFMYTARVSILHEFIGGWHHHKFAFDASCASKWWFNSCCIKLIGVRNSNYSIPLGKMILPFSWKQTFPMKGKKLWKTLEYIIEKTSVGVWDGTTESSWSFQPCNKCFKQIYLNLMFKVMLGKPVLQTDGNQT